MTLDQAQSLIHSIFTDNVVTILTGNMYYELGDYEFYNETIHPLVEYGILYEQMNDDGVNRNGRILWEYRLNVGNKGEPVNIRIRDLYEHKPPEYWSELIKYARQKKLKGILSV